MSPELSAAAGFAAAGTTTLIATPLAIALARRTGFYDRPRGYRAHGRPTPFLGGAAVLAGFLAGALAFSGLSNRIPVALGCAVGLWALGTIDDRVGVPPALRVAAAAGAAIALFEAHLGFRTSGGAGIDLLVTAIWTIGLVNAFNLIDNLDGACATTAAVSAAGIGTLAALHSMSTLAGLGFALAGGCAAFLVSNLARPARIFLGDGGSMPVGMLVATLAMATTRHLRLEGTSVLVGALLAGLPILDTTLVTVSRTRRGIPLLTGGRDHLTHRIAPVLGSPRGVAAALALVQAALCSVALMTAAVSPACAAAIASVTVCAGALAILVLDSPRWRPASIDAADHRPHVMHIIARLNIGGPANHAITLTKGLAERGYQTTLVCGREEPREGSMEHLATALGIAPVHVPTMRRNPGWRDLPAMLSLIRIIRSERPAIVHTHAAKGGALGRVAVLVASLGRRRPVLVHTFHGHSLTGYFSPRTAAVYRLIERLLAAPCDRLLAVSDEVRDELVAMGVAPASKFEVVALGFDLSPFTVDAPSRAHARTAVRAQLAIPSDASIVTLIARLAPIKRVDRFLRVATRLSDLSDVHFLVVGDGELRDPLRRCDSARMLGDRLHWAGFRGDMPSICFASDVVAQTSDNEGTPVSLIEAQAAGVPVVSTRVGGTCSVVSDDRFLAPVDDEVAIARAVRSLLDDRSMAAAAGAAGRAHVLARFDLARLLEDVDALYDLALERAQPLADAVPRPSRRVQRASISHGRR